MAQHLTQIKPIQFLGVPTKRLEDNRFIIGKARYTQDVKLPNMHYLGILRSEYPHAFIREIDVLDAQTEPGIIGVFTGRDIARLSRPIFKWFTLKGLKMSDAYCLATNKVRYVGEPIAAVVGKNQYVLQDALEKIVVDYDPIKPVISVEDAENPASPLLYEEWKTNLMLDYHFSGGNVKLAFEEADNVVEAIISSHRYCAAPLETRSYVAQYSNGNLLVWASSQQPFQTRTIIAETIGIPESKITVVPTDLGGGFGAKQPTYCEESLTALMAKTLDVPVSFTEQRKENLTSMHQAREQSHHVQMALKSDGGILGIRDVIRANLGAYLPTVGPGSVIVAGKYIPSCYKVRNYEFSVNGFTTNKPPYGALRGFGKDAANYVIERMMNIAADELGIDYVQIRQKNLIRVGELPYRSVTGPLYDSGDYSACMWEALRLIQYEKKSELKRNRESAESSKLLGVGFSLTLEATGSHNPGSYMLGYEGATVRVEPSGKITALVGTASMGTGHETLVAQIVAQELGLERIDDVTVTEGDTKGPFGFGAWASRTTPTTGGAVVLATRDVRKKLFSVASRFLSSKIADLDTAQGLIYDATDPSKRITIRDIATAIYTYDPPEIMEGVEPGLESTRYFMPTCIETVDKDGRGRNSYAAHGNSAHAAMVEVDEETGKITVKRYLVVTDCGRVLNPLVAEAQVTGGVVQGMGGVLLEENLYNKEGLPVAITFLDYLLPSAQDTPVVETYFHESPSPFNPLGSKGLGENPIEGVTATLVNAVEDALAKYEVRITSLPLTPSSVLQSIWQGKRHSK